MSIGLITTLPDTKLNVWNGTALVWPGCLTRYQRKTSFCVNWWKSAHFGRQTRVLFTGAVNSCLSTARHCAKGPPGANGYRYCGPGPCTSQDMLLPTAPSASILGSSWVGFWAGDGDGRSWRPIMPAYPPPLVASCDSKTPQEAKGRPAAWLVVAAWQRGGVAEQSEQKSYRHLS